MHHLVDSFLAWHAAVAMLSRSMLELELCVCEASILVLGWTVTIHIRCVYGNFGKEITKSTVPYSAYIYGSGQPYLCVISVSACVAHCVTSATSSHAAVALPVALCDLCSSWRA